MDTNSLEVRPGRGPYQHHSREFKCAVVELTLQPGASVARIAREHGINANQVFAWRRLYRAGQLAADSAVNLLAVELVDPAPAACPTQTQAPGGLVLDVARGRLHIEGRPDAATLRAVLEHLLR